MKAKFKLKRIEAGRYRSGKFEIWHECRPGHENRWYLNHSDYDETLVLGGFPKKWQAVKHLEENGQDY